MNLFLKDLILYIYHKNYLFSSIRESIPYYKGMESRLLAKNMDQPLTIHFPSGEVFFISWKKEYIGVFLLACGDTIILRLFINIPARIKRIGQQLSHKPGQSDDIEGIGLNAFH